MLFEPYLQEIADAYDALEDDPLRTNVRHAWEALAADSVRRADEIRDSLRVGFTDDSEPYPDAFAMIRDIRMNRHFLVSRANCDHPIWSVDENVAFRIVHDVLGHDAASLAEWNDAGHGASDIAGFDWAGENRACSVHFPLLPAVARPALFTECIAQTGYACAKGEFGPQKVGFIRPNVAMDHPLIHAMACAYLNTDTPAYGS